MWRDAAANTIYCIFYEIVFFFVFFSRENHPGNADIRLWEPASFLCGFVGCLFLSCLSHNCGMKMLSRISTAPANPPKPRCSCRNTIPSTALSPAAERFVAYVLERIDDCPLR